NLTPEPATWLARYNYGRGATDSVFAVNVAQPGVYPLRLVWQEGGGGANVEFFSVSADGGTKVLLNDSATAGALKSYRARTGGGGPPTLSIARSGSNVTITFSAGSTLQSAPAVNGPFTDVAGATSPHTAAASQPAVYYRARR
ncbi:MAG: hypothetical protein K1X57_21815, partial [Gemmataceae bacterium]|nr:hypothetical protein [Gemmataceae bacterium]